MPAKISAGILMFRRSGDALEVLLAHPGGPFFKNKDEGIWTIPKGVAEPGEDLTERAKIEFEEELGIKPTGNLVVLGTVRQKGGKIVHAWATEGDLPENFELKSNPFQIESPAQTGNVQSSL